MKRFSVYLLAAWLAVLSASAGAQVYVQGYPGGKATLVAQTTGTAAPSVVPTLTLTALAAWANSAADSGNGTNSNPPTNATSANGFPNRDYATVKATATTTGTCSLTVTIPIAEVPTTGTRKLVLYYKTTAPAASAAIESMTGTINNPGGTGNGQTLPLGDYSTTPYTLTLTTVGTSLSVTFFHQGTAAATSTGSWSVDAVGVNVPDYFAAQSPDTGLAVKSGRVLDMALRAGTASSYLAAMGVGNSAAAASDSDTQLGAGSGGASAIQVLDSGNVGQQASASASGLNSTFNTTFPPGVAGLVIREAGLVAGFSNSSPLYCRIVLKTPFQKSANQSLAASIALTGS